MSDSKQVLELLYTARQLSDRDFENFFAEIQDLHQQKNARENSLEEAKLLKRLSAGLPRRIRMRWDYLIARRDTGAISEEEYEELLHLTESIERMDLKRLKWMAKLSEISNIPLSRIPQHFGLQPR